MNEPYRLTFHARRTLLHWVATNNKNVLKATMTRNLLFSWSVCSAIWWTIIWCGIVHSLHKHHSPV